MFIDKYHACVMKGLSWSSIINFPITRRIESCKSLLFSFLMSLHCWFLLNGKLLLLKSHLYIFFSLEWRNFCVIFCPTLEPVSYNFAYFIMLFFGFLSYHLCEYFSNFILAAWVGDVCWLSALYELYGLWMILFYMQIFAEKLMYFSDSFNAKLFLSRVHQNTSSADLEAGALALKTDLKGRTQQRKQLVKDNFDCFVSCKTTIDGM